MRALENKQAHMGFYPLAIIHQSSDNCTLLPSHLGLPELHGVIEMLEDSRLTLLPYHYLQHHFAHYIFLFLLLSRRKNPPVSSCRPPSCS